jgi:hypothetical protein
MRSSEVDMLAYLVDMYKDFYIHKDLFNKKFKYSINDIDEFLNQIKNVTPISMGSVSKEIVRDDILALKTPDDVKRYLEKVDQKNNSLKELSLNELGHLYKILYYSPIKSNMRKFDVLNSIERYFAGISRAVSMKP